MCKAPFHMTIQNGHRTNHWFPFQQKIIFTKMPHEALGKNFDGSFGESRVKKSLAMETLFASTVDNTM